MSLPDLVGDIRNALQELNDQLELKIDQAAIDHVLATDAWEVVGFRVIESLDDEGSDHRPIVAQLRPASG